jgi:hypothetical protein
MIALLAAALVIPAPPAAPKLVLPDPRISFAPDYARTVQARADASPTAVERPLAKGALKGSLGYLCGINYFAPGSNEGGPASSYGHSTTFLGAKLSVPFR